MNAKFVAAIVGAAVAALAAVFIMTLPQENESVRSNAGMLGNGKDLSNVVTAWVEYYDRVSGFLARPDNVEKYPAIIMIHEFWGINDNIKGMAR